MPRKPKAPYGYKPDGTPRLRRPQARWVKPAADPIAEALKHVEVVEVADATGPINGLTGAVYTPMGTAAPSALAVQVGGDHYKTMPIQPMEFSMKNKLDPCQHTIIKYVTRFRDKGGIQDLEKAKHVIDMLIQFETTK